MAGEGSPDRGRGRRAALVITSRLVIRAIVLVLLGAAACGGRTQEPLLGVWQVTAHTHNPTGCATPGPAAAVPPFVQFVVSDVDGQQVLELVDCTSAAACATSAGLSGRLFTAAGPWPAAAA